ncbi:MAG: hypothetical protein WD069_13205 [Planctomycetales bacterium]
MSPPRLILLLAGPPLIVGGLYALTAPDLAGGADQARETARVARAAADASGGPLDAACAAAAERIRPLLDRPAAVIVRPPYVLAGDVGEAELTRRHQEVLVPLERALRASYFDRPPDRPVTIVMLKDEASFRRHAARLDGSGRNCYAGYYLQGANRMVLNLATGDGTLAHEFTHALAHFDFPALPEWLDEGLAALHEESEFSPDGLELRGLPNWRRLHLVQGHRKGLVRGLESLVRQGTLRANHQGVDYAHARDFCLYLQQRRLLAPYYRKFRTTCAEDPTGERALLELLGIDSLDEIETEFRRWVEAEFERGRAWSSERGPIRRRFRDAAGR